MFSPLRVSESRKLRLCHQNNRRSLGQRPLRFFWGERNAPLYIQAHGGSTSIFSGPSDRQRNDCHLGGSRSGTPRGISNTTFLSPRSRTKITKDFDSVCGFEHGLLALTARSVKLFKGREDKQ